MSNLAGEEKSAHEPCQYDPSRAVQCVYCKPAPPPAPWRHQEIPAVWNVGGADLDRYNEDERP